MFLDLERLRHLANEDPGNCRLDEVRLMATEIERLRAEVERYATEALLALAGVVPTPEKGYGVDGGPGLMGSDIRRLRGEFEGLREVVEYCKRHHSSSSKQHPDLLAK